MHNQRAHRVAALVQMVKERTFFVPFLPHKRRPDQRSTWWNSTKSRKCNKNIHISQHPFSSKSLSPFTKSPLCCGTHFFAGRKKEEGAKSVPSSPRGVAQDRRFPPSPSSSLCRFNRGNKWDCFGGEEEEEECHSEWRRGKGGCRNTKYLLMLRRIINFSFLI